MPVKIILIIKILDGTVKLFLEESELPNFYIVENNTIENQIVNYLENQYEFLSSICQPQLLSCAIKNKELNIYYTMFYPKDFIDEKNINKVSELHRKFCKEDAEQIKQGIQIYPY